MRILLKLCAFALTLCVAQTLLAAEPAGGLMTASSTTYSAMMLHPEAIATKRGPSVSATLRMRMMALSAFRLNEARRSMQSLADLSAHHLPASSSLLEQLPVVASMRRRAGERWNTTDSSRPSDFALCYRVSRVMGLQIVPGDLTPSKLPTPKMVSVKDLHSGMGVLVGMTFRLGRGRK